MSDIHSGHSWSALRPAGANHTFALTLRTCDWQFMFVHGSARALVNSIKPEALERLAACDDGEPIEDF